MGKTYRKAKMNRSWWGSEFSQRIYWINKMANDSYVRALRNGYFVVKKTKREFDEEFERVLNSDAFKRELQLYKLKLESYEARLARYNRMKESNELDSFYKPYMIEREPRPWVSRCKHVPIDEKTIDVFIKEEAANYDKYYSRGKLRDGVMTVSRRSSGFKASCSKGRRISDKVNYSKLKKNIDLVDEIIWQDDRDGKNKIWDWW